MASNTPDEQRLDYYEFKRKHDEWLKTFSDVRHNVEDSQQRPAPVPYQKPQENAVAAASSPVKEENAAETVRTPSHAAAVKAPAPEDMQTDLPPSDTAMNAREEKGGTVLDEQPTSPEIPEIFIGEEKFNTAPIEKAAEEFLTEEELAEDEREPNPFDSLFHAVDIVKEKWAAIRRKRRSVDEEDDTEEEDSDLDALEPADSFTRAPVSAEPEPSTAIDSASGFSPKELSQTQKLRQRYGRPESETPQEDILHFLENSAKSKGGRTMSEQDSKSSAELSQLLAEGMSGPTLSRRERRAIEQKNDSEESPTQVYRPVREASARTVNASQIDEEDEEEIVPRKSKVNKKAKASKAKKTYDDDFDDLENFDDFDDEEPEEASVKRGKAAKKTVFHDEEEEEYDDYGEEEVEEADDSYDDEDYDDEDYDEEDESSIGKRILNVIKAVFIVILVLALLFVALRLLEGQGIIRLTGLRGVINSISPEAAEWLLPEPSSADLESESNDLPSLDNDGFDNSFTDDGANFGPVDDSASTVDSQTGIGNGDDLFPTVAPTQASTAVPTAAPTAAPTQAPFDDSQLSADDIFNALP